MITVSIMDTGCGISEENKVRIFDLFYSTKSEAEGAGLGLYTSYSVIKNHGGTIEVFSTPGQGTTFVNSIPGEQKLDHHA